jgi:hypothetical protein
VHRLVRRYLGGTLDAKALRTLLAAVRPLPGDPVAPVIATVLNLPSDPTTDEARRDLLTGLVDEQRPQSPTRSWRP